MQRAAKAERRRYALNVRLASTNDPLDRVSAATDYFRATFVQNPDPAAAERVVALLLRAADDLSDHPRKETR
jgi:plasmid stabilization system protein ParE